MSSDLMYASVFLALAVIVLVPSVFALKLKPSRRRTGGFNGGRGAHHALGRPQPRHQARLGRRQL